MDTFNEQMTQLQALMLALEAAKNGDTKLVGVTPEAQAVLKVALVAALTVQIRTLQRQFNQTIGVMVGGDTQRG